MTTNTLSDDIRVKTFLERNPLGTLATLAPDGRVALATLFFLKGEGLMSFFVTKTTTRKYENILKNPQGTVLVSNVEELTTLELSGRIEVVTDSATIIDTITRFQALAQKSKAGYWVPPASQVIGDQFVVCKHIPDHVDFKQFSTENDVSTTPRYILFDVVG